jgi:Fic-DOC domain mobile mystery protein B
MLPATGWTGPDSGMTELDGISWRSENEPDGVTPLSDEEKEGLRPSWIATRADLNAAEAANIGKALAARRWQSVSTDKLLDDLTLRDLHRAMFRDVWKWAGMYRLSEKNIGSDPRHIAVKVRDLCANAPYWLAGTSMSIAEAGCRFHRDLVAIHPFSNGNGRHSRAATDLLMRSLGDSAYSHSHGDAPISSTRPRPEASTSPR